MINQNKDLYVLGLARYLLFLSSICIIIVLVEAIVLVIPVYYLLF